MNERDVGGLAEEVFETWCKAYGITANKALNDEKGWDYFVQFPSAGDIPATTPLDIHPPEFSCLLQVKGSDRRTKRWPVKLSNWQHLVKIPLPTFFLILEFDSQLDPQQPHRGYLVHVGESWVTEVLKRLRQLSPKTMLHRKSLYLKWTEVDRLEGLNGSCFREAVRHHINADLHTYTVNKARWLETIGYEEGHYAFSVRMTAGTEDELMARLVDFAIGFAEKIPVAGLTLSDNRFGVPVVLQDEEFERGELSMQREPDKTIDLRLRDSLSRKAVILKQANVYNPSSVFPFVPERHLKIRIVSDFVQLLLHPADKRIEFTLQALPFRASHTVDQLDGFQRLVDVLIEGSQYGFSLEAFGSMSQPVFLGRVDPGYSVPPVVEYVSVIRDAIWLCNYLGISRDTIVTPEQLISQDRKFGLFRAIFERSSEIELEFKTTITESDPNSTADMRSWAIVRDFIEVGEWRAILYARLRGEEVEVCEIDGPQLRLKPKRVVIEECSFRVIHQSEVATWDDSSILQSMQSPLEIVADTDSSAGNKDL